MRYDRHHEQGICADCGLECESVTEDDGIGAYEYWGAPGNDVRLVEVSPCCGAEVVEGGNTLVRINDHVARKDHKDGKIKAGEAYRIVVTRCWRRHGPSWYYVKIKTGAIPVFRKFKLLEGGRSRGAEGPQTSCEAKRLCEGPLQDYGQTDPAP